MSPRDQIETPSQDQPPHAKQSDSLCMSAAIVDSLVEKIGVHIIMKKIVKTAPIYSINAQLENLIETVKVSCTKQDLLKIQNQGDEVNWEAEPPSRDRMVQDGAKSIKYRPPIKKPSEVSLNSEVSTPKSPSSPGRRGSTRPSNVVLLRLQTVSRILLLHKTIAKILYQQRRIRDTEQAIERAQSIKTQTYTVWRKAHRRRDAARKRS